MMQSQVSLLFNVYFTCIHIYFMWKMTEQFYPDKFSLFDKLFKMATTFFHIGDLDKIISKDLRCSSTNFGKENTGVDEDVNME